MDVLRCDRCRRRKERCDEGTPCGRCQKHGLECSFGYAWKPLGRPRKVHYHGGHGIADLSELFGGDANFLNVERIHALEHIVRHYTGIDQLTTNNLEDHIVGLSRSQGVMPHDRRHSKGQSIGQWAIQPSGSPDEQGQAKSIACESL